MIYKGSLLTNQEKIEKKSQGFLVENKPPGLLDPIRMAKDGNHGYRVLVQCSSNKYQAMSGLFSLIGLSEG